jgi:hypothetical protein
MTTTETRSTGTGGVGVLGLLGVAFVVLKLTGVITWPWIWVLAPFWIPFAIAIIFLVIFFVWLLFNVKKFE